MNIIKIKGVSESYIEAVNYTTEWYVSREGEDEWCDLHDAQEMVKSGGVFTGVNFHLIHYPEGTVHTPFELKENIYVNKPIWDEGKLHFLRVDFSKQEMQIYSYSPDKRELEMIKILPLGIVKDCYNLMLEASPLMLCRHGNDGVCEIVWPENKKIIIGDTEQLSFRDGNDLYFSKWYEDPEYREEVIIRDLDSGGIKEQYPGYLVKLAGGVCWRT